MENYGTIKISNDVIAVIAGIAASEVSGVYSMSGGVVDGIAEMLGKKNLGKGVKVEAGTEECVIELNIVVEYGVKIIDVAKKVQASVYKAVTEMTGLKVVAANVNVLGVHIKELENETVNMENNNEIKLK